MEPRKSIRNVDNSSGRRKINTLELVDRISALPDFILGVILSLLPTKNTVATSTLSKRWKFLWRTVHNLDFYLDVHGLTKEQVEDENNKFIGFVNHVLLHHDAGVLNKFRLEWTPACIQSHVTSWIKTAITRNVHELSLALDDDSDGEFDMPISVSDGEFDMPISIFSCDSLLSLLLNGWICLYAPTVFCLPKLERLDLDGVNFQSNEAFENIIRGCPVLNYLHIKYVEDDDFRYIISSTSLRCLKLNVGNHKYLQLEASSLEHLELCGLISVNFVQKKLTSVVKADLDYEDLSQAFIRNNSMVDAVSALDCARILTLSDDVMRVLSYGTMGLSTKFERLVKLETSIVCCHWSPLLDLIQRSNNLEVLTINKLRMDLDPGDNCNYSDWTTPVKVPRCLSTSLKKVVLNGYYGDEDEREMIRYMLNHGSALEVMQISYHRRKKHNKYELLQEISEFPRKSPACKVKFFEQVEAL